MENSFLKYLGTFVIIIFLSLISSKSHSQDYYSSKWKDIDSLLNYGLNKSADLIVDELYIKSKSENNTANFIRANIYKLRTTQYNTEDFFEISLNKIITEESSSQFPTKQFLNMVIGELYWNYYQQNRYKILNRSEVVNFKNEDIKTWDAKKFVDKAIYYFKASLTEPEKLQQISIENFNDMLNYYFYDKKIPNGRIFRPTLYDFLANHSIGFFSNKETGLTRPAEQFLLNDPIYLNDAEDFVKLDITTTDTYSFDFYTLNLYKDLIKFHLNDSDPQALVDADLNRLKFVYENSSNTEKGKYYLATLENLQKKYSIYPVTAMVNYEIADYYYQRGKLYKAGTNDENKDDIKKAFDICKSTIEKYPEAIGSTNCISLLNLIETKNLQIQIEACNTPDKPFRILTNYRNINKLYFKIVETNYSELQKFSEEYYKDIDYDKNMQGVLNKLSERNAVQSFSVNLPGDNDFQENSAEIKFAGLPKGLYFLLAATDENFTFKENAISYCVLSSTNISYINKQNSSNSETEFFVLNRETGEPIQGVNATVIYSNYDYNKSKYVYSRGATFETNSEGYFKLNNVKKNLSYYLDFEYGDDRLLTQGFNFGYGYLNQSEVFYQSDYQVDKNPKAYLYTHFFTDRSIYRPGQTIYFKGVVLEYKGEEKKIKPDTKINVQFFDVNYQMVEEKTFFTNEYGTINGSFTIPTSGLTGQMFLKTSENTGTVYFSVEDYKRPKFEVTFEPIKGSYKLNEMVSAKGIAKSYSGATLDNANVKYRVVRKVYYPRWYYSWFSYYDFVSMKNDVEIINGTTKTNANGEFEINFKALADESVSKQFSPYFNFEVIADVTDINGETHSKTTNISVGYKSLLLNVNIPENVDKNFDNTFKYTTTNLNGEKEPAEGKIEIYKLKTPDRVYRKRMWNKPTKFIYTKEEFNKDLPYDEYNEENNFTKWEKDFKAFETSYNSGSDSILNLSQMKNWNQGKYVLEITAKDKFGETITEKFYFDAYSTGETTMPYNTFDKMIIKNSSGEPGQSAEFLFGSSLANTRILFEAGYKDGLIKREWLTLNNAQRFFTIPIKEDYRGNIYYSISFIRANRIFTSSNIFSVPYTNKELDITFETFRNKLLPGENEEWKINIKGKKGDKVAAEMLATMYDASLDAINAHNWNFNIFEYFYNSNSWNSSICFDVINSSLYQKDWNKYTNTVSIDYDNFNWFGAPIYSYSNYQTGRLKVTEDVRMDGLVTETLQPSMQEKNVKKETEKKYSPKKKDGKGEDKNGYGEEYDETTTKSSDIVKKPTEDFSNVVARKDFRETVFFLPDLRTDENGNLSIKFQMPDALTKWKMMGFAITKDLSYGLTTKDLITQKDLMVTPNLPRYFREDDKVTINAKITNLSGGDLEGEAVLKLYDATNNKEIDAKFKNDAPVKSFNLKSGQNANVSFDISIPYGFEAVNCKIFAKSGKFTDGEETTLPVLTNRMLVTETMPMYIRGNQTKNYTFDKLVNNNSNTLTNYQLSLEFTSNPAWYAIQAMPYLMEYPYECAEQVFSRLYANSIATNIMNSSPKIKQVFDTWKNSNPEALLSNLEKNEELKSLILQETPWVLQAKDESERKRRMGVLFELNTMRMELDRAVRKLKAMQVSNGAWPWFEGMPEDRYITQHIIGGFGKLNKLGIRKINEDNDVSTMVYNGLEYLDNQIKMDYDRLVDLANRKEIVLSENHIGYMQIHYLYVRSFYKDIEIPESSREAFNYFLGQADKYWLNRGWYSEGMIALALNRFDKKETPQTIVKSMNENSLNSDELGMYWKENIWGYYWYEAPIETQALLIEVFDEVANDAKSVDDMKVWLLKQKQTQDWKTTKATVEAIYALILKGNDWLTTEDLIDITVGTKKIEIGKDVQTQAGTGYFKTSWNWGDVKSEMGNISVTRKSNEGISWGSMYWQYFEDLDKISKSETNLKIDKQLFLEKNTLSGPVITPINETTELKPGDLVKVRIEIRTDRNMEYVHLKDMRAAGFEPVNVISQYKYQEGLGYYESTRDAATNFFISYLPKGTYVFEYPVRVNLPGDYSNGITSIQCMYAPEFTSHSEGIRVKIRE